MNNQPSEYDPVEELAESFLVRYRRGERPSLSEYTAQHPELAEQIRSLFPALVLMEEAAPSPPSTGEVPRRLGEYLLLREVGRGGMGVVYEALQESLGRRVAVKVLPHVLADARYLERFRREAKAAAKLHHTNIVPVFGVGVHEGVHFYAMQFIDGQGLDAVLRELRSLRQNKAVGAGLAPGSTRTQSVIRSLWTGEFSTVCGPLVKEADISGSPVVAGNVVKKTPEIEGSTTIRGQPQRQYYRSVARLGVQIAEALAHAHQHGILHRDVKPSNLLLDGSGTVWVTDFGLAKAEGTEELTQTGDIVGTLRYMAPERFSGRTDARSEVYSLGVTLYELLTLKPAFDDDDRVRLIQRITQEEPPRPRRLDPSIPLDLETVVLKAMAKEPEGRYETASALAEDLHRFLLEKPVEARRIGSLERAWRWCRRNPWVAGLGTMVVFLLLIVAGGTGLATVRLRSSLHEASEARKETADRLWEALVEQARVRRLTREPGRLFLSLEALDQAAAIRADPRLRNEYIACLALSDLRPAQDWLGIPFGTYSYWCDPWLECCARSDLNGMVHLCSLRNYKDFASVGGFSPSPELCLSPHGVYLAVWDSPDPAGGGQVQLFKVEPTSLVLLPPRWAGVVRGSAQFSPDGTLLACQHLDRSIGVYETTTGKPVPRLNRKATGSYYAFHPRNQCFAVAHGDTVEVLPLDGGTEAVSLPQTEPAEEVAWHPEGDLLAVAGKSGQIALWDMAALRRIRVFPGHSGGRVELMFSHGGGQLASLGIDNRFHIWDTYSGAQILSGPWIRPWFSADDRGVGISGHGEQLRLWEQSLSRVYRTFVPSGGRLLPRASLDGTGRLLAVAMPNGISIWDLQCGRELIVIPIKNVRDVLFGSGSDLLVSTEEGVVRLPAGPSPTDREVIRYGPPIRLPEFAAAEGLAVSRDGHTLAAVQPGGALVHRDNYPGAPTRLTPHHRAYYLAMHPEGLWLATSTMTGAQVKIWDIAQSRLLTVLPLGSFSRLAVSADGNCLATDDAGVRLWDTRSWKELPPPAVREPIYRPAFSPDGRLLAAETYYGFVVLIDRETRKEVVRLEDPNRDRASWIGFTPDGTRLVTLSIDSQSVHIWDLRQLRHQLAQRNLDWDLPSYPPEGRDFQPHRLEVLNDGEGIQLKSRRKP
jgi:serine/threonine protein kinase/WD40 repeat protein